MGPRTGLDNVERRTFLPLSGLELRLLRRQPVTSRYTDCAIPAALACARIKIKFITSAMFHISFNGSIKSHDFTRFQCTQL
jgi:hypothetical protein